MENWFCIWNDLAPKNFNKKSDYEKTNIFFILLMFFFFVSCDYPIIILGHLSFSEKYKALTFA